MFDSLQSIKNKEDLENAKRLFLDCVTFTSKRDCQFLVKSKIYFEDFFDVEKDFIESSLKSFNENKSFLFGYQINNEEISNIRCKSKIYEIPALVIKNAETVDDNKPLCRFKYLIADIKNDKDEIISDFHFPPVIDFVTEAKFESFIFCKYQVYEKVDVESGVLLLTELKKILYEGKNEESLLLQSDFQKIEYTYQLSYSNNDTTVYNKMKIIKDNDKYSSGKYKAIIITETDSFESEEEVKEQLSRWLKSLGKGLEIAKVII